MPGFHFTGQRLDRDLVSSVSNLLTEADIPNLLWGNYLLSIYGVPTIVDVRLRYRVVVDFGNIANNALGCILRRTR